MSHRKAAGIVWNSFTGEWTTLTARRRQTRCYYTVREAEQTNRVPGRLKIANRVRLKQRFYPVIKEGTARQFTATASSRDDQEPKPNICLSPRKSSALSTEADACLDRALSKDPDEEWDAIVFPVDKLRCPNRTRDNSQYYNYMEVIYDDIHDSRRASQKASNIPWYEILPNIECTEVLLKATLGTWKLEQWSQAEDLLLSWWTSPHSLRSVVLQIALTLRILREKEYLQQNDIDLYMSEWFNSTALNRIITTLEICLCWRPGFCSG